MIVSLLAAFDEQGVIGYQNRLPWHLSDDLRRFKRLTMGHHVIMGRKTHESIGKPLPGRTHIVISRNPAYTSPGCIAVSSLKQALETAQQRGETEAFVIGGGEIFTLALPIADRMYLTWVHARVPGDVFFPSFSKTEWQVVESQFHPADAKNEHPSTFQVLERKHPDRSFYP